MLCSRINGERRKVEVCYSLMIRSLAVQDKEKLSDERLGQNKTK